MFQSVQRKRLWCWVSEDLGDVSKFGRFKSTPFQIKPYTLPKTDMEPEKEGLDQRWFSVSKGWFSGAMLASGVVSISIFH